MKRALTIACLLAISATVGAAKPDFTRIPDLGVKAQDAGIIDAVGRRAADGRLLAVYQPDFRAQQGTPEAMAREYLNSAGPSLGLEASSSATMSLTHVRSMGRMDVVRFQQTHQGLPVWGGDTAVSVAKDGQILFVANGVEPGLSEVDLNYTVKAGDAIASARAWAGARATAQLERAEQMIYAGDQTTLVWRVQLVTGEAPYRDLEVLIDAQSGEIVRAEDQTLHLDAAGRAFNPDPLSTAQTQYTVAGYGDNNDQDSPQLLAEIKPIVLRDLTLNGGVYELKGPWAACVDHEAPNSANDCPTSPTADFVVNSRSDDRFEPAHVYFHIDTYMRYLNDTLGLDVRPPYVGGVQFDAHGLNGDDNSHFLGGTSRLAFGDGGVDDAEDADVVIHELGHGVHYWLTNGGLSNLSNDGLSEGLGDYLAMSYSRAFNHWASNTPEYFWMFSWDGHNNFWPGRVTNWHLQHSYAAGNLGSGLHTPGQYWASCNMLNFNSLGQQTADKAVLMGIAMTNGSSRQNDAAQAVLNAAAVNFPPAVVHTLFANYTSGGSSAPYSACTYNVTLPTTAVVFADGFE
ncbi:MAG: hypothetical protein KDI60_18780 [Xanthomonadales bacterium]|nr:hypothetical protein [Xanthomonadales bacterium]MCP5473614.1 peptidase [Rhodanobacteraceae bacterium]